MISSRIATPDDLDVVLGLYRELEVEQAALRPMWPYADGVAEPADQALVDILADPESRLVVGEIADVILGFAWGRSEPLLPQAEGDRIGVIRLIYTVPAGRGVGIGDVMAEDLMTWFRSTGHHRFDARVSPGHRHAKNFFEAHGFSARLIVMHHDDHPADDVEDRT